MFVTRIWPMLLAAKRFGEVYGKGMDILYPKQRQGNLMIYCPACPEAGVNMEPGWQRIPKELRYVHLSIDFDLTLLRTPVRHINAIHIAVDGNFQTNHYAKNGDANDIPLFAGRGYMPDALWYKEYLKNVPQLQNEVRLYMVVSL